MKKIITLGEVMLRLSPRGHQRFVQSHALEVEYGGSEANVGAALAFWGHHAIHITSFPDHEIGWAAKSALRSNGIDTSFVQFTEGRMGIYFLENGAMQRSSQVIYDRADSSFSKFDGKKLDWDTIFGEADWIHWSGITPALSQESADLTLKAIQKANEKGLTVSGDLNYRSNLWKYGKAPHEIMPQLMELTHVMIAGTRDFNQCLNQDMKDFEVVKDYAFQRFKQLQFISKTERVSHSSSHNTISGALYSRKDSYYSKSYELTHIVDRVGTGDAFGAGLIAGLLESNDPQEAIEFAVASGAIKHSVPGDILNCTKSEIEELIAGVSGKIKR